MKQNRKSKLEKALRSIVSLVLCLMLMCGNLLTAAMADGEADYGYADGTLQLAPQAETGEGDGGDDATIDFTTIASDIVFKLTYNGKDVTGSGVTLPHNANIGMSINYVIPDEYLADIAANPKRTYVYDLSGTAGISVSDKDIAYLTNDSGDIVGLFWVKDGKMYITYTEIAKNEDAGYKGFFNLSGRLDAGANADDDEHEYHFPGSSTTITVHFDDSKVLSLQKKAEYDAATGKIKFTVTAQTDGVMKNVPFSDVMGDYLFYDAAAGVTLNGTPLADVTSTDHSLSATLPQLNEGTNTLVYYATLDSKYYQDKNNEAARKNTATVKETKAEVTVNGIPEPSLDKAHGTQTADVTIDGVRGAIVGYTVRYNPNGAVPADTDYVLTDDLSKLPAGYKLLNYSDRTTTNPTYALSVNWQSDVLTPVAADAATISVSLKGNADKYTELKYYVFIPFAKDANGKDTTTTIVNTVAGEDKDGKVPDTGKTDSGEIAPPAPLVGKAVPWKQYTAFNDETLLASCEATFEVQDNDVTGLYFYDLIDQDMGRTSSLVEGTLKVYCTLPGGTETLLTDGTDYTLTYRNGVNATFTVTPKGYPNNVVAKGTKYRMTYDVQHDVSTIGTAQYYRNRAEAKWTVDGVTKGDGYNTDHYTDIGFYVQKGTVSGNWMSVENGRVVGTFKLYAQANGNNVFKKDAVLKFTDTLPDGLVYVDGSTMAWINDNPNDLKETDKVGVDVTQNGQALAWSHTVTEAEAGRKCFTVTFKVYIDEAELAKVGNDYNRFTFRNTAYFTVNGKDVGNDWEELYYDHQMGDAVKKSASKYTADPSRILFTVEVNKTALTLNDGADLELTDTLKDYLSFDPTYPKAVVVTDVATGRDITADCGWSVNDENKLTFRLPDAKYLKVEFIVKLVGTLGENKQVENTVNLQGKSSSSGGGSWNFVVSTSDGGLTPSSTTIRVVKYEDGETHLPLANAAFELRSYASVAELAGAGTYFKKGSTGSTGKLTLTGIKYGSIYTLTEIKAPAGYKKSVKRYVIFFPEYDAQGNIKTAEQQQIVNDLTAYSAENDIVEIFQYKQNTAFTFNYYDLKSEDTDINVVKVWEDGGETHPSIVLRLFQYTTDKSAATQYAAVTLPNADGTWTHSFSDLPSIDENETAYHYYITEEAAEGSSLEGYTATWDGVNTDGSVVPGDVLLTNSLPKTDLTITKKWVDEFTDANATEGRPSVVIDVFRSDNTETPYTTVWLPDTESKTPWQATLEDLPTKFFDGTKIVDCTYTLVERAVDGYVASVDGSTVTNSRDTDGITVSKVWTAADGSAANAPEGATVTVNLLRKVGTAEAAAFKTVVLDGTADENGETAAWTATFGGLMKRLNGEDVTYSVTFTEAGADGFLPTLTDNGDGTFTLTNKQTGMTVVKQDASGARVGGAAFTVTGTDGSVQTLANAENASAWALLGLKPTVVYTLHETQAPQGYFPADADTRFILDEAGKLYTLDESNKATLCENNVLVVTDTAIDLGIVKLDDANAPQWLSLTQSAIQTQYAGKFVVGATLQLLHKGEVVKQWSTADGQIVNWSSLLTAGETYTLHELSGDGSHFLANDITFTVDTAHNGQTLVMVDAPIPQLTIRVNKTWGEGATPVDVTFRLHQDTAEGAELASVVLKAGEASVAFEGTFPAKSESGEDVAYAVTEDAVNGFLPATPTQTGSASDSLTFGVTNTPIIAGFVKVDADGKGLGGATLTLVRGMELTPEAVVDTWTSDASQAHPFAALIIGETYTLIETAPPAGYYKAASISFTVGSDGTLTKVGDGDGTVSGSTVTMKDTQTVVSLRKADALTGATLAGATFKLWDESKTKLVYGPFTSAAEATVLTGVLESGKTYWLEETAAPKGYQLPDDPNVKFTVPETDAGVVSVTFEDSRVYSFLKTNASNGRALAGARLVITDESGEVVVPEWTSTATAKEVVGTFETGVTYLFREKKAPSGFVLNNTPIRFRLTDEGTIAIVNAKGEVTSTTASDGLPIVSLTLRNTPETPTDDTIDLTVVKRWRDNNNAGSTRPTSITVNVYRKLSTADSYSLYTTLTLNDANNWSMTLRNLKRTNSAGVEYDYRCREDVPDGYTASYSNNGFTIVNSLPNLETNEPTPSPTPTVTPTPTATIPTITATPTATQIVPWGVEEIDGELYYIDEYGVPLGLVPQTGDESNWLILGAAIVLPLLLAMFAAIEIYRRKRRMAK